MNADNHILKIDDDPDQAAAVRALLEHDHCSVDYAGDTETGFGKAQETRPDLIILDVMFGHDKKAMGFPAAIYFRVTPGLSDVPILMLTAINQENPAVQFSPQLDGKSLPVDAFLEKPCDMEILRKTVAALLAQKTSRWACWPNTAGDKENLEISRA